MKGRNVPSGRIELIGGIVRKGKHQAPRAHTQSRREGLTPPNDRQENIDSPCMEKGDTVGTSVEKDRSTRWKENGGQEGKDVIEKGMTHRVASNIEKHNLVITSKELGAIPKERRKGNNTMTYRNNKQVEQRGPVTRSMSRAQRAPPL